MTIEYRGAGNTKERPAFVACPKCSKPMQQGEHWPQHWIDDCPANPAVEADDE